MIIDLNKIQHDKYKLDFIYHIDSLKSELNYEFKGKNTIEIYKNFIDPELRGKEIAQALLKKIINYAKEENHKIYPSCLLAVSFFKRHKECQFLLTPEVNFNNAESCRILKNRDKNEKD